MIYHKVEFGDWNCT